MRYVVLDTETTGLEVRQGHRIIEIGCIEVNGRQVTDHHFHQYINPEREVDEGAFQVHGISDEMLADKPKFKQIAKDFLDFVQGSTLIIHNASFDIGFLDGELERLGLGKMADYVEGVIDSLGMAREMFPGKRNNLDALCDRLGVNNAHRQLHGALLDSQILAEVYLAMTRGQDSLVIDLNAHPEDDGVERIKLGALNLPEPEPSAEELAMHVAYLADIEKAAKAPSVWSKISQPADEQAV
ncbi:DNA polymerase III subunit epsilon [Limnobacter sp.]|jgi:DNA polymerase-3 subunit epsilon|uniref:DNA polymerase III subunit epsilon n=1 Tax=Limnobacter sp. TaxID=2003368 RepID=UPI00312013C5